VRERVGGQANKVDQPVHERNKANLQKAVRKCFKKMVLESLLKGTSVDHSSDLYPGH
jgi:hypothetical protein